MGLVKVKGWQLSLIRMIVLPVLSRIHAILEKKAQETPEEWDDVLAAAFKIVIEFLKSPQVFEET